MAPLEMLHNWQMLQKSGQKVWCLHNGAFYRVKVMGVASGGIVQVQYCSDHSFEEVDVGRLSLKTAAAGTMTASAPAAATNTTLVAPATVVAPAAAGISIDFDVKEKVTRLELAQMQEALGKRCLSM